MNYIFPEVECHPPLEDRQQWELLVLDKPVAIALLALDKTQKIEIPNW
jgi:hypothetical protein